MRVLLIKQSSLGDLIHCFPAISDLHRQVKDVQFDWLVEKGFVDVPRWHKGINEVIPIDFRYWRKNFMQSRGEIKDFFSSMRRRSYDLIIDAQALIKSAVIASLLNGKCTGKKAKIVGLDRDSIRTEKFCTLFYHQKIAVPLDMHAIERVRRLFAQAFHYDYETVAHYPLFPTDDFSFPDEVIVGLDEFPDYVVGVHSTSWNSKHLPLEMWYQYAEKIQQQGKKLVLPWYGEAELTYAKRIQKSFSETVIILPQLTLNEIVSVLRRAWGIISVDTGYAHIAAAMGVPIVTLYGSTNKNLTAALGLRSDNLQSSFECSPCMTYDCKYASFAQSDTR